MSKSLTNPSRGQIIHRNRQLANALMENKRKATMTMRDDQNGRCCLQVAEDYAISCGLPIDRSPKDACEPCAGVGKFFGWDCPNPFLITPNGTTYIASTLNDGAESQWKNKQWENKGLSHKKIAECILNTYVTTKRPKWSFELDLDDDT